MLSLLRLSPKAMECGLQNLMALFILVCRNCANFYHVARVSKILMLTNGSIFLRDNALNVYYVIVSPSS